LRILHIDKAFLYLLKAFIEVGELLAAEKPLKEFEITHIPE
jgi:hypothetical protein